ncbi:Type II toxin-antitoxin system PemK/MazF family toxin [Halorhabdus sp. BNX81]|nr:Type II toxin-antitoxin system PemK/MazF family toxin [Halorhabdus sp. BNX81]
MSSTPEFEYILGRAWSMIRTISIEHRIRENLGSIPDERMSEVDTALEYSLGLVEI